MKDREGVPRGLPEAGGGGNPQAGHLLQDQPWLPGQGAVGSRLLHWRLAGDQRPPSRIPSMEQCLEYNRRSVMDGGHGVDAPRT